MLNLFRQRAQGIITWLIIGAITVVFAFVGLSDGFSFSGKSTAAKVNGEKISWQAVDMLYANVSRQYGNQGDPSVVRNQIVRMLVQRSALTSNAKKLGFQVSEQQVANLLVKNPAFQVDGKFSEDKYKEVLGQSSYSDRHYRAELLNDVLVGQMQAGIALSNFTTPNELKTIVSIVDQQRDFGYAVIPPSYFKNKVKITPEQIADYYERYKTAYIQPEQVILEYVQLDMGKLIEEVNLSPEEVQAFYRENEEAYSLPERIQARHILIAASHDEAEEATVQAKAEALVAQLKDGADFTELAKQESQDVGSAQRGGELGWLARGQTVPEFETVAFGLKPGEISEPVRTQFGYHIIQLVSHKPASVRSFKEVKNLVEEQLKRERAAELFAQKSEVLERLAFENKGSLDIVEKELGLKVQETQPFGHFGGEGIARLEPVLRTVFTEEFLKDEKGSQYIKLSDNEVLAIRLKEHHPSYQLNLEQAREQVQEHLADIKMKGLLDELAAEFRSKVAEGQKPANLARQQGLKWVSKKAMMRSSTDLEPEILSAAYQLPSTDVDKQPVIGQFVLPSGDFLLLSLNKVKVGDVLSLDSNMLRGYSRSLAEVSGQLDYIAYSQQVMKNSKIEIAKSP